MKDFIIERGSIFHQKDFEFEDGSSKDKYLITLNCKYFDNHINFVLTTSQSKYYQNSKFRHNVLVIEENESTYFNKQTFIDVDRNVYECDFNSLKHKFEIGDLTLRGVLEVNIIKKIERMIRNSDLDNILKKEYLCE